MEVLLKVIDHWFSEIHFFLFLISSNPNPSGKNVSSTPQSLFPTLKMGNFQLQIAFPNTCLVYGFCSLFSVADPAEESGGPGPTLSLDRNEALI